MVVLKFGVQQLVDNVGMGYEWIILLIAILAALIIAAKHFQISMIVLMVSMGAVFVWFYERGFNWTLPLVVFFMSLIVLALSLYAVDKTSTHGGFN